MKIDRIYRKLFLTMLVGMFSFFMVGCSEEEPEECYVDASAYLPNEEEITQTTVTLHGEISISAGVVTEYGFYLSDKRAELETAAPSAKKVATGGSYANFSRRCTGLKSGTPYYFRAFASNGKSSVFGKIMEFSTKQPASPTLDELIYSAVTDNSVDLSCTILDAGVEIINTITYGFEYKKSGDANWTPKTDGVQQNEDGSFSVTLTGLSSETDYEIRAFAKNEIGNGYSSEKSITTGKKLTPVVSMDNIDSYKEGVVTATGVKVSGYINEVYSEDGAVSEVGFLYGTSYNLTYASAEHFKVEPNDGNYGTGGTFMAELVNLLQPNTQYYICPYAKDEGTDGNPVYGYGDVKSFTTREFEKPRLDGLSADTIKANSISVSISSMTYDGALVEYGFIWGKFGDFSGTDLTLDNCGENKVTFTPADGKAVSSFSAVIGNLETNTEYQIKAYAISSYVVDGEIHKSEVSYVSIERTTADLSTPSLNSVELNNSTYASLSVSSGIYSYDETATLTECGFIWLDDATYQANGYHQLTLENCGENKLVASLSENNTFECTISDLEKGTAYQVAAYATVTYPSGETRTGYYASYFTTSELSTPLLIYVECEKITYTTLSVRSSAYYYDETATLTECGFIWMDNTTYQSNQYTKLTLENCGENKLVAALSEDNAFNGTITGLNLGTEYQVAAYVTITYPNGEQRTGYYGNNVSTSSVYISVTTDNIGADSFTATATAGKYGESNNWEELGETFEAGFCWATKNDINPADIPEENRMSAKLKDTDYQKTFTSDISVSEKSGTTYYVWAYLKYNGGIIYSECTSVTSKNIPEKDEHGNPEIKD